MSSIESTKEAEATRIASVPQLMDRVGTEMRELAAVVNDLEMLVGNLVIAGAFGSTTSIYDLQKLDHLRQSIGGIAEFVEGIGRCADPAWKVNVPKAAEAVTLAELCDRLRGIKTFDASPGDMDFFSDEDLVRVA